MSLAVNTDESVAPQAHSEASSEVRKDSASEPASAADQRAWAMGKAAQAWCQYETERTTMDYKLAVAFADILVKETEKLTAELESYRWDRISTVAIIETFLASLPEGFPQSDELDELEKLVR